MEIIDNKMKLIGNCMIRWNMPDTKNNDYKKRNVPESITTLMLYTS